MEYIISQDTAPSGELYEDETYCTRGLCAHPSCWESHIRLTRGFKRYATATVKTSKKLGTSNDDEDDFGKKTSSYHKN